MTCGELGFSNYKCFRNLSHSRLRWRWHRKLIRPEQFHGNITVTDAGAGLDTVLQLGTNNAFPDGVTTTLNGGSSANGAGALDLNGFTSTVSNLTFSSTGPNYGYVTNSAFGTTGALILGNDDATETLQFGTIMDDPNSGGTVALGKVGNGVLTLSAGNTYSGSTTISAGTLLLTSAGAIPNSPNISLSGTNVIISGTNGLTGAPYYVLSSTNLALPLANWTALSTNTFKSTSFSVTNAVDPSAPRNFYLLRIP